MARTKAKAKRALQMDNNKSEEKKKRRRGITTTFKRNVKKYQTGSHATSLLTPRRTIFRFVQQLMRENGIGEYRLSKNAVNVLHESSEELVRILMMHANTFAIHSNRIAVSQKDVVLAAKIMFNTDKINTAVLPFTRFARIAPEEKVLSQKPKAETPSAQ